MRLLGISDLHLRYEHNRQALEALSPHPDDWLILAGDTGETEAQLAWALEILTYTFNGDRFAFRGIIQADQC